MLNNIQCCRSPECRSFPNEARKKGQTDSGQLFGRVATPTPSPCCGQVYQQLPGNPMNCRWRRGKGVKMLEQRNADTALSSSTVPGKNTRGGIKAAAHMRNAGFISTEMLAARSRTAEPQQRSAVVTESSVAAGTTHSRKSAGRVTFPASMVHGSKIDWRLFAKQLRSDYTRHHFPESTAGPSHFQTPSGRIAGFRVRTFTPCVADSRTGKKVCLTLATAAGR